MDAGRLISQLIGMFLRKGTTAAVRRASASGKPRKDMTAEEREQARAARETLKRARQALRVTRRFGKF